METKEQEDRAWKLALQMVPLICSAADKECKDLTPAEHLAVRGCVHLVLGKLKRDLDLAVRNN
jgi:hypothetical protein